MGQGRRLFKQCLNLPPGNCGAGVQAVKVMWEHTSPALWGRVQAVLAGLEPTSLALLGRGACCLRGVGTNLPCTMGQGYRLFKRCQNLPSGHCGAGV